MSKPKLNLQPTPTNRIAWIEGIRLLAVILILLYHAHQLFMGYAFSPQPTGLLANINALFPTSETASTWHWVGQLLSVPVWFGFQFVDVLILLSGLCLVLSLKSETLNAVQFLQRRLLRLLWPFWTVALLSYPVLWAIGEATDFYAPSAWSIFAGLTFPLLMDYRGGLLQPTSGPWWFIPLIMTFTLISPWLWMLMKRWGARNVLIVSSIITFVYRAMATYWFGGHPTYVILDTPSAELPFQSFLAKLGTFVVGMAIAQAYRQQQGPMHWKGTQAFGLGTGVYTLGFISQFYQLGWVFADALVALGLFLMCMVLLRLLEHLPTCADGMVILGKHSYSFFLIHNFVIDRTLQLIVRDNLSRYLLLLPAMIAVTLFLAIITDAVSPFLQKVVLAIWQDLDQVCTLPSSPPSRTWTPAIGDCVTYQGTHNWIVLRVEKLLDNGESYLCQIAKDDRAIWVAEAELTFEKRLQEVWQSALETSQERFKKRVR